jgi:dTDP-4-dehydrorhamnose reductase
MVPREQCVGGDDEELEGHVSEAPRIVLFGVNGQVGHRLLQTLNTAGYEVTGIDRARCDLATATAKEIATIIRAVEPQLVINATAYTGVDAAETDNAMAQRLNAEVPGLMAAACEEQHVPFLHFSTDYVFDGLRGAPYRENAEVNPVNAYAVTKRAGEVAVQQHKGHIFRLQWVFDARGKNFFLTMKKLLTERPELKVVADQLGAPSNALHIARAVTQAAPKLIDGVIPVGIYHLTAGGSTSWHGFACAIAKAVESTATILPLVSAEYPLPATRPKDARLNCSALASYGVAMPHWREGLTSAMGES